MSRRTESRNRASSKRIEGRFLALPHDVLDSMAYVSLSHTARSLLLELGRQYMSNNNGMLVLSAKYLRKRGWNSADVLTRAKRELLKAELIYETVMGHRPNKASRYAVTWASLDSSPAYDFGAEKGFVRGAYRQGKYDVLIPSERHCSGTAAPVDGVGRLCIKPSAGAVMPQHDEVPTPSDGNHLDMPSNAQQSDQTYRMNRN